MSAGFAGRHVVGFGDLGVDVFDMYLVNFDRNSQYLIKFSQYLVNILSTIININQTIGPSNKTLDKSVWDLSHQLCADL